MFARSVSLLFVLSALFGALPRAEKPSGITPARTDPVLTEPCGCRPNRAHKECAARAVACEREVEEKLNAIISVQFEATPLRQAMAEVQDLTGLRIAFDKAGVDANNFDLDRRVSLDVEKIPARSVLNLLLKQANLHYELKDGVLQVTGPEPVKHLPSVTYPVADLVAPLPGTKEGSQASIPGRATEEKLIELITSTIAPKSWNNAGGKGTIYYQPMTMSLVIVQRQDVQEQVADLLAALRRLQDVQVVVQISVLRVSEDYLGQLSKAVKVDLTKLTDNDLLPLPRVADVARSALPPSLSAAAAAVAAKDWPWVAWPRPKVVLTEQQLHDLCCVAQGERNSCVKQFPRVTMFSGQQGVCLQQAGSVFSVEGFFGNDRTDVSCRLRSIATAERKSVRIDFELTETPPKDDEARRVTEYTDPATGTHVIQIAVQPEAPSSLIRVKRSFQIGDGKTAVLYAGKYLNETRGVDSVPILGEIPFLDRFFTTEYCIRENQVTLILVTPRVIVREEKPAKDVQENSSPIPSADTSGKKAVQPEGDGEIYFGWEYMSRPELIPPPPKGKRAIEKWLETPVTLRFKETPLHQALKDLNCLSGVDFIMDKAALREAGIDQSAPITLELENVPFKSALLLMLKQANLTYDVRDNDIFITIPDALELIPQPAAAQGGPSEPPGTPALPTTEERNAPRANQMPVSEWTSQDSSAIQAIGSIIPCRAQAPGFTAKRTQVKFAAPTGMKVYWYVKGADGKGGYSTTPLEVPGRYNFLQAAIFRLKLTNIPGNPGMETYPTLEVVPSNPKTAEFLAHNAVPVSFTDEDFKQVKGGNYVVKVIYLPNPSNQGELFGTPGEINSTQLPAGADPIQEAQRHGQILLVIRMGNINP